MRLFVGDDWAEDHHGIEVMDEAGTVLARKRVPEGAAGMAGLHGLIGGLLGEDADDAEVVVGIGTDRGPWVTALIAAGYRVFPVNPLQAPGLPGAAWRVAGQERCRGRAHAR
jgi:Transposase